MSRLRVAASLAVAALVAAATGCANATPDPTGETVTASSISPNARSSPDSKYFAQARENPRRFVRRWSAAGDAMQTSGQTRRFVAMSSGCQPCEQFAATVRDVHSEGGSVHFRGSSIVQIRKVAGSDSAYLLTKDVPVTTVKRGDGDLERYPGGRTTFRIFLETAGASWAVHHYFIEPAGK